jgi:hypothetical protein
MIITVTGAGDFFMHPSRSLFHGAEWSLGSQLLTQYQYLGWGCHATNDLQYPSEKKCLDKMNWFGAR